MKKLLRFSEIIKEKKGMTLVETVVTFIIAGILITASGGLIIFGMNMFQETAARNLDKQIGDSVSEVVWNELNYADFIEGVSTTDTGKPEIYEGEGFIFTGTDQPVDSASPGRLYIQKPGETTITDIFPNEDFYSGRKVAIKYLVESIPTEDTDFAITFTVNVYNNGSITYHRSRSISPPNIGRESVDGGLVSPVVPGDEWDEKTFVVYHKPGTP